MHGVEFEAYDIRDGGEGASRWRAAGRPVVPSLVVDGAAHPILHVSQLSALLGLPSPPSQASTEAAWGAITILRAWLDHLRPLPWGLVVAPTPSRARSLRELTVNTFHPFELLPDAWESGRFDWYPELDAEREARLTDLGAVLGFAQSACDGFGVFLLEVGDELDTCNPLVSSPRGELRYSTLLTSQRWHAAFHYRQLRVFLESSGFAVANPLSPEALADLELPAAVF